MYWIYQITTPNTNISDEDQCQDKYVIRLIILLKCDDHIIRVGTYIRLTNTSNTVISTNPMDVSPAKKDQ